MLAAQLVEINATSILVHSIAFTTIDKIKGIEALVMEWRKTVTVFLKRKFDWNIPFYSVWNDSFSEFPFRLVLEWSERITNERLEMLNFIL